MRFCQIARDCQAEPDTAGTVAVLLEGLEHALAQLMRNTVATVDHVDAVQIPLRAGWIDSQLDGRVGPRMPHRIGQEVPDNLLDTIDIEVRRHPAAARPNDGDDNADAPPVSRFAKATDGFVQLLEEVHPFAM